MGRHKKIRSAAEIEEKWIGYKEQQKNITKQIVTKDGEIKTIPAPGPLTVGGFCAYMGITRQTLAAYEGESEKFFTTIKAIKQEIEANLQERTLNGELNCSMAIFSLKNNFGWKDKQEVEHTGAYNVDHNIRSLTDQELEEKIKQMALDLSK